MSEDTFRMGADFEPQEAVVVGWPRLIEPVKGVFAEGTVHEIVRNLIGHVDKIIINCGWPGSAARCREILEEGDIDLNSVIITEIPDKMHWARDYGPDIMGNDKGEKRCVHFRFDMYGMGEEDSEMSIMCKKYGPHMAIELGCYDLLGSTMISEGGDKEFNGAGVMMAVEDTEVRKRNPDKTKEQVEEEFKRLFNLKKIIWLPYSTWEDENSTIGVLDYVDGKPVYRAGSANGHCDEIARFVDKNTVLLLEISEEEAAALESARITKERCDMAYEVLKNSTDAEGNPFRIIRIPAPIPEYVVTTPADRQNRTWGKRFAENEEALLDDGTPMPEGEIIMQPAQSYVNYLVCNDVVIAQSYWQEGKSEAIRQRDAEAMAILQKAYPDRKVIPVYAMSLNLSGGGGIHCLTKNVPQY
ncbi:agmatine deiminase family protein [Candidatus Allofournierella excrementavium]|uniref:agmatine deiminase family protein n=1 Tax=Candidatus Allofournierella excrementavium TaxID=2838591 RepID=UPI003A87B482